MLSRVKPKKYIKTRDHSHKLDLAQLQMTTIGTRASKEAGVVVLVVGVGGGVQ